jgi:ABC-type multidrug transport system permease subunit
MKPFKNRPLYQLTLTQFLETIREPEVLFWGIVFPVLLSIGLGLAFTQKTENRFHIILGDHRPAALDSLLHRYAKPESKGEGAVWTWKVRDDILGHTEFIFESKDWESAIVALKRGEAEVILSDSAGTALYHFDPYNAQAQLVYMKLSELVRSPEGGAAATVSASTSIRPLTLQGVRYIDFLVPGLIAFGIMSSILWGVSYTLIEWRSQKLLRRMVATPMRKSDFLVSLMFVRIVMNFVEALILFLAVRLLFDIRIQGNIGALLFLFIAGNIAFTGIAVLVSCRTSKTEVGTGWINAVQMPMMILSGIFFSYHNFPEWSLRFIKMLPLTALADGMRSIFNEGAGWMEILTPSLVLAAFGMICFLIGMRLFKWY